MSHIPAPSIEYGQLSPMLIVFGVGVVGVLVEAFVPRRGRYGSHLVLALGGLVAAFAAVLALAGTSHAAALGAVAIDGPTLFLQGTILLVAVLAVALIAERQVAAFAPQPSSIPGSAAEDAAVAAGAAATEVFPLTMLAVGGLLLFPAANDLLTMFIALEVLSLPLYLLCGLARKRRLVSQEAALKYFLLGAFSSAFFLYGVALLYGYAGTVSLTGIANAIDTHSGHKSLALVGLGLLAVGLLFKVGAVPFHAWTPDVYQGAPTPITGFMAAATKVAAFGAMLRICYVAVGGLRLDWRPMLWAVAIATMALGAIAAVAQTDVKRMLAYSSIAHAGFILTGLIAANKAGLAATLFYLGAYAFSTLGAFAVVGLVRDRDRQPSNGNGLDAGEPTLPGDLHEATAMARWAGLGRRSPLLGSVFALFLLAFAGIPLTSGFVSKFAVFQAAVSGGATPLVIVGVISSAVAAGFYIRVIVGMFFAEPPADAPVIVKPGIATTAAITVGAAVTVVLGIAPQPVLTLTNHAAQFLH